MLDMPLLDDTAVRTGGAWFGYGRWDAPYWFLGLDQGGGGGGEGLGQALSAAWASPGGRPAPPAWRRLIQLMLAYQGRDSGPEAIQAYQEAEWGNAQGEATVLELLGARARALSSRAEWRILRRRRIATLREKLDAHQPAFVLCYGMSARQDFARLFDFPFDREGYSGRGATLGVLVRHPASRGGGDPEAWVGRGREMAKLAAWMPR